MLSVWHEFNEENEVTISGFEPTFDDFSVADESDGTFGEVSVGLNVVSAAGWSASARAAA